MSATNFWQGVRFLVMGAIALGTAYVILYVLADIAGLWYLGSSFFAMGVNYSMTFVLHKFVTYRDWSTHQLPRQIGKYVVLIAFFQVVNVIGMYALVDGLGLWHMYAQAIVSVLLTVVSMRYSPNIYRAT